MQPHTPHDRRALDSSKLDAPAPNRSIGARRARSMALSMLVATLLLAAIIGLAIVL